MPIIDEESLHTSLSEGSRSQAPTPVQEDRKTISVKDHLSIPAPPASSGLRLPMRASENKAENQPRLLHPLLNNVPMHVRFGLNGFLSNVGFMVAYNSAVVQFEGQAPASTIYAVVYLVFIPVSHALISLLVFGWPDRYLKSLMSNAPIGLTAIALGAMLTAYLDQAEFNKLATDTMAQYWKYLGYDIPEKEDEKGEFYSSLVVLLITGVWTFVLSVLINAPTETSEKKEN
eukprot:Nitzschia sp. Nitz4//scaffold35_size145790//15694//16465//NITZ4_003007-RA/size145790-augustus-gene-0.110-mRNA-1//1//CDS//3329549055//2210//frame0